MLCDNLKGWEVEVQEGGIYMYQWMTHTDVWQKPIQYCKAIILQLNN